MKKILILLLSFFLWENAAAQTQLSDVINDYTKVTAIQGDSCANQITVTDASSFSAGDQVVLIQMQGAQIVESNSSAFGDIASMNGAGLYEIQEIESINGNAIFFQKQLKNTYEISGNVQLVSMPAVQDAEVTSEVTATAWDGEKGGVIALQVNGQLTLNADINASGKGFRGADNNTDNNNSCTWLVTHDDYFYTFGSWRSAGKGEGVANTILGKEFGKGPQSNGGGGGNDHNTGGGGGANVTDGGFGGENDEPDLFGCRGDHPGEGGKGIMEMENRIFFGGGGGAGHENNDFGSTGGNGGGIIILMVNEITTNGFTIKANGEDALDAIGDGAGGGGAGGTILVQVQNGFTFLATEAKGGKGGTIDNLPDKCHGPGGGGSGGRIISNMTADPNFAADLNGGDAGLSINSTVCSDGPNGATAGMSGTIEELDLIVVADEDFSLPVADFSFDVMGNVVSFSNLSQNYSSVNWDFGDGNLNQDNDPTHDYDQSGTFEIQLIVTNDCGVDTLMQTVEIIPPPEASFGVEDSQGCVPLTVNFNNGSTGAIDTYSWTFEGGNPMVSSDENPTVVYETPGIYDVQLVAIGPGGNDSVVVEELVVAVFPAVANFDYTITDSVVVFENLSSNVNAYSWDFGDGSPIDNSNNPTHTYSMPGTYEVTLTVSSDFCDSTISQTIFVDFTNVEDLEKLGLEIFPNPTSDFLNIKNQSNELTQVQIFALDGKPILEYDQSFSQNIQLDIQALPAGVYFLKFRQKEKVGMFRVVKIE